MATYYADNTYKVNPIRATLFEAIYAPTEHPGIVYEQYFFKAAFPVGFTVGDVFKCFDIGINFPVTSPQYAAFRFRRAVLRSQGNVGGSVTVNFGTTGSASAFGAALTTLQSATTAETAVASIMAAPNIIANDTVQIVGVANTTTTAQIVDGLCQYCVNAP